MAEIPALYAQRPIVHRHKNAALYHPFVEALALTLVDIPITFGTCVVFGIILYFMVGLQQTAVSYLYMSLLFPTNVKQTESILVRSVTTLVWSIN